MLFTENKQLLYSFLCFFMWHCWSLGHQNKPNNFPCHCPLFPNFLGGVDRWLSCQFLAGRLYVTCAWSVVDWWPLCR